MLESRKVELKHTIPVEKEGGGKLPISELTFRRVKLKHLKLLPPAIFENPEKINPVDFIPIIAGLADIPVESAEEIDISDLADIVDAIKDFLAEFPDVTGKSSSGE